VKNTVQKSGKVLTLTAPYTLTSGQGALIGGHFGVAVSDITSGASGQFLTKGVVSLAKQTSQAWAAGDKLAWDDANKVLTNDLSKGPLVAVARDAALSADTTGIVKLGEAAPLRANSVDKEGSVAPVSISTAGAVTYTAAQIMAGIIVRDTNGASRTDVLPTAALLVAAVPGAKVGDVIRCKIVNGADAAEVLTIQAGSGGAYDANQTASSQVIPQNASKELMIRLTNVTASSEAYVAYL
jgi:predicted RecA/RadA family phage recombinase